MKRSQHRVEAVERSLRRRSPGVAMFAKPLARACEALLHRSRCNDERRGDLGRRQSDDRGQCQGGALAIIERGMAARKHQPEKLVLPAARDVGIAESDPSPRAHLPEHRDGVAMAFDTLGAPQSIAMAVARNGHEPRFRTIGLPIAGPARKRALDRVVNRVLCVGQASRHGEQLGEYPRVDLAESVGGHPRHRHDTGRTSTA